MSAKKQTIKDKVLASAEVLKAMQTPKELRDWAISNGMDNRSAFPKFKDALQEIDIDYNGLKNQISQTQEAELEAQITHEVTLFSDAKASRNRFAITDEDGNPLWYGQFFDNDAEYNGEQSSGELASAKKAVWLASKIKESIGASAIRLNLMIDAQWLCYQDHAGQKGFALTILAKKYNIQLNVQWISGKSNPADRYTVERGFQKWSDNDLSVLGHPLEKILNTEIVYEEIEKVESKQSLDLNF